MTRASRRSNPEAVCVWAPASRGPQARQSPGPVSSLPNPLPPNQAANPPPNPEGTLPPSAWQEVSRRRESLVPRKHPHILWGPAVSASRSSLHPPSTRRGACALGALPLPPLRASELHLRPDGALAPSCGQRREQPLSGLPSLSGSARAGGLLGLGPRGGWGLHPRQEGPFHRGSISLSQRRFSCPCQPRPCLALEILSSKSISVCQPAPVWMEPWPDGLREIGV